MQIVPAIAQPSTSQQVQQIWLAIQQQAIAVTGTQYVPPLSSCNNLCVPEFKWYKRYGIAYDRYGNKKAQVTQADVVSYLAYLKHLMDLMTFEEKVQLLREGYLSFSY